MVVEMFVLVVVVKYVLLLCSNWNVEEPMIDYQQHVLKSSGYNSK